MPSFNGLVEIRNGDGDNTILLDGDTADITAGGNGQGGNLVVGDAAGAQRVSVDGPTGTVTISTPTGDPLVTVDGQEGDVVVFRKIGSTNREVFRFDASDATLTVGAQDSAGELVVLDGAGVEAMRVSGGNAALYVGAALRRSGRKRR